MIKKQSLPGMIIVLSILFLTACAGVSEPGSIEQAATVEPTAPVEQEVSSETDPTAMPEAVATEAAVSEEAILVPTEEPAPVPEREEADWTQTAGIDGDYFILGNPAAPIRLVDFSDFM